VPYPAGVRLDNVISVAYTTRHDTLALPSNYGHTNVHLAAPGDQIYSAFPATDSFYYPQTGTSFAVPHVTGACALLLARYPTETHQQIISRVLNGTDPLPSLAGKCVTGGRLNLRKALSPPINLSIISATNNMFSFRVSAGPNRTCVIQSSTNLANWSPISTNTASASGTFDFTDNSSGTQRLYRVLSSL
jgi:subtilisin family serine protease